MFVLNIFIYIHTSDSRWIYNVWLLIELCINKFILAEFIEWDMSCITVWEQQELSGNGNSNTLNREKHIH